MEEALYVEWVHAIAPGAQVVLVEANSQSLSDLMAGVATAASQPGVSVVSISWGFAESVDVTNSEEALYDSAFTAPGVTFVASTGDYGAADPEYPAFSPNVVAVGGTSLTLNANNSYNGETGWGYYSNSAGDFIGSGGGISQYETEPSFQQGVQSTGYRTTPDVSFVADPATGAWIADPYNLPASNPFEVVGGTSLSAPAWAGLLALVNQGRVAAGAKVLNSASTTEAQQDLYSLSQSDYNVIASGNNGYSAAPGYNLVTGLGTPVANSLVSDMIAGNFPATGRVAAVGAAQLVNSSASGSGNTSPLNAFNVFVVLTEAPAVGDRISSSGSGSVAVTPHQALSVFSVETADAAFGNSAGSATTLIQRMAATPGFGLSAVVNLVLGGATTRDALFAALAAERSQDGSGILALRLAMQTAVWPVPASGMLGRPTNQPLFGAWGPDDEELETINPSWNRDSGRASTQEGVSEQLPAPQWFDRRGNDRGGFVEEQQPVGLVEPAPVNDAIDDGFAALSEGGFAEDGWTAAAAVVGLTFILRDRQGKERVPGNGEVSPLQ
jgi:hypothetical protein